MLIRALERGDHRIRGSVVAALTALRDERAGPLCWSLLGRLDVRRFADVYLAAIDTLGAAAGGVPVVDALREALYRGDWWAPFRTRALRTAAARALGRIGGASAIQVLHDASPRGPRGVRAVARAARARMTEEDP